MGCSTACSLGWSCHTHLSCEWKQQSCCRSLKPIALLCSLGRFPSLQGSADLSPLSLCVFLRQCTALPVCQFRFRVPCVPPFPQDKGALVGQRVQKFRSLPKKFPVPKSGRIPDLGRTWGTDNFLHLSTHQGSEDPISCGRALWEERPTMKTNMVW